MKPMHASDQEIMADLVAKARHAGADAADAVLIDATGLSVRIRLGEIEKAERSEHRDLGLRVLVGKRQAIVSSADFQAESLTALAERAVAMARSLPEDPFCGLADAAEIARQIPDLDLEDPHEPTTGDLIERAKATEESARAVPGVTNSEGAEADWSRSDVSLYASNGFYGRYRSTGHAISTSVIAGSGTQMEADYDYAMAAHGGDLESPDQVGRRAGERAVRRLNPRKLPTAKMPVIFDPRVAGTLLGHFAGAINGAAIARGTSFLKDRMGQPVFGPDIDIVDDPLRRRGLGSLPFDAEGLPVRTMKLVENGVLRSWLLDLRSARQLGLPSTGHATRGTSSPPSPHASNLYLAPGKTPPDDLIKGIADGFYVTGLSGMGVNGVTGDYSRGANGFRIEKGVLTYPVSEVTIAGNLLDMFKRLTPANDLVFRYRSNAPTLLIDGLTLAGL